MITPIDAFRVKRTNLDSAKNYYLTKVAVLHITDPRIHSPFSNRSIDQIGQNAVKRKSAAARLATKISVTFEVRSDFCGAACSFTC